MISLRFNKILGLSTLLMALTLCAEYDFDDACKKIGLSDGEHGLKVLAKKNTNRSFVTILQDKKTGKKFIIKQLKKAATHPMQVIQEMLGTYVVNWLGLLSQKVIIVPPHEFNRYKEFKNFPATLHTFIDAKPIKNFRKFKKLTLRQIKLRSSSNDHGLNRKIIASIAQYYDLAAIVAADTFLGIDDRHKANLLFSDTLQRFWLIDMDYTYHSTLVEATIKQIQKIVEKSSKLTAEEYDALERYKATLKKLNEKFSKAKMMELIKEFIQQAGITEKQIKIRGNNGIGYTSIVANMERTTEHIEKLISLLDLVIEQGARHKKHLKKS